jgi:phosphoglycerol transferase MdoB-like AlkP superfamily enzyme
MVTQCPVPKDQRPLNEYNELKNSFGFRWTIETPQIFFKTLILLLTYIVFVVTFFISNMHDWKSNIFELLLWIISSSFTILTILLLRLYLAWEYIYNRLMNASVTYEESGWYDGQTWIKTNEILIQDRLIGSYEVLPILHRLKLTLTLNLLLVLGSFFINLNIKV